MLIVNYVINTFYRIEKTEIMKTSMTSSVRSTIEKNGRRKIFFKTNLALVPKINSKRKEEGATVAATPTFPHSAGSLAVRLRAGRAAFYNELPRSGKGS